MFNDGYSVCYVNVMFKLNDVSIANVCGTMKGVLGTMKC